MEEEQQEFHGFKNVEEFSQKVCKSMVGASRAFQQLPAPGNPLVWDLRKSYPEFNRGLKSFRSRLVNNMVSLMQHANISASDFRRRDVDEKMEFIVEANDQVLEGIAMSLDKAEGLFKRSEILVVNPSAKGTSSNPPGTWKEKKLDRINMGPDGTSESAGGDSTSPSSAVAARKKIFRRVKEKPQLKFKTPPDNSLAPFVPKLKYKPNSIKPLSILPEYNANNEEFYGHPYAVELNKWKPKEHMLERNEDPVFPASLKDTPFMLVENARQMEKMLLELGEVPEIAVDLEHHSYRSFLGITCLLQISSRTKDYIVDCLALREQMHNLNEVFTNPKILKVFHGATSDIQWLQKDFSVYVVGMFDTFIASQTLQFPQGSYQYLLSELCKIDTDKAYQLADWRLRPLPKEMAEYARKDTHYLLYIYDILKNRLIDGGNEENNLLQSVYEQSRLLCLKRYEKPVNNPQVALRKCKKPLNNRQLHGFVELFKWRDQVAREKDESLHYVLPNHMLLTIAETLPKEMTGILACCDPVPIFVNHHLSTIHQIVTSARELPMHHQEPSMQQQASKKSNRRNWMLMMDSVHEVITEEPSEGAKGDVLSNREKDWWLQVDKSDIQIKTGAKIRFGGSLPSSVSATKRSTLSSSNRITPYSRYKLTHEIIRNLKDPSKKDGMDLENPVIKSVVETILVDPNEEKEDDEAPPEPSRPTRRPTAFDRDEEFVPFNPMSVSFAKKKGKKRKREEEEEANSTSVNIKTEEAGDEVVLGDSDDDEDVKPGASKTPRHIPVPKNTPKKKGQAKKKRKNLLKRLAQRGKKRKYEMDADNDTAEVAGAEDGEITEEVPGQSATFPRRQKGKRGKVELTNYTSLGRGKKNGSPVVKREDSEGGKKNKKKKKGFFKLRSNSEGKSITFK